MSGYAIPGSSSSVRQPGSRTRRENTTCTVTSGRPRRRSKARRTNSKSQTHDRRERSACASRRRPAYRRARKYRRRNLRVPPKRSPPGARCRVYHSCLIRTSSGVARSCRNAETLQSGVPHTHRPAFTDARPAYGSTHRGCGPPGRPPPASPARARGAGPRTRARSCDPHSSSRWRWR